ncbi:ABC transporter permease [Sinanaerobacter sp. ZZT-01]|uniref:ABC transporter permease n=1 Tax=Sinanaerobacter sp. ZZT-01 TaxID=3111540 RepID=UPI002D797AFC|nr:ABC transporter permease subunit [Sinanaerobacter sp. ZZT-01]WRR93531.1 ABC transporter permease subunit [Sinanaerobacter sp. ZZT-01]
MRAFFKPVLGAVFWLLLFQIISMLVNRDYIFPSPAQVFQSIIELVTMEEFYLSVGFTMIRVVSGMFLSFILGVITVFLAYFFPSLRGQFQGITAVLKSMPVLAVVLYAVLWMPSSKVPIFVCFLMCYPVIYTNLLAGLDAMNPEFLELCKVYQIGLRQKMIKLYYPEIKPHIKSAMSLVSGLSWKTVVAGEVISIPRHSMGYHLMDSKIYFETAEMFAWIIMIVIFSVCFERGIKVILKWI